MQSALVYQKLAVQGLLKALDGLQVRVLGLLYLNEGLNQPIEDVG
jgi:hypothetical protein